MVSNQFLTQEDRDKILFSNSFQEIEEFIKTIKRQKLELINQSCFIPIALLTLSLGTLNNPKLVEWSA